MLRQKTRVRKQQITEAVRSLILTKGMESVTVGAIAEAVGLTEGAIYRHFASKNEILWRLVDDLEWYLLDTLEQAQVEGATTMENLESILEAHLSDVEGSRAVSLIVVAETMAFDGVGLGPRVSTMLNRYVGGVRRVLEQGVKGGELRSDLDLAAAATAFFGIIQSTAIFRALNNYTLPLVDWRYRMWEVYKQGIATRPSPMTGPKPEETGAKTPMTPDASGRSL